MCAVSTATNIQYPIAVFMGGVKLMVVIVDLVHGRQTVCSSDGMSWQHFCHAF